MHRKVSPMLLLNCLRTYLKVIKISHLDDSKNPLVKTPSKNP